MSYYKNNSRLVYGHFKKDFFLFFLEFVCGLEKECFRKDLNWMYRESPVSTNFVLPGNRTIAKIFTKYSLPFWSCIITLGE